MSDLTVIVPSRGRPQNIVRLMQEWHDTQADARLCVVVDADDPTRAQYPGEPLVVERKRLCPTLNEVAMTVSTPYVGFIGDDHSVKVPGWDALVCENLASMGTGIVYGDDGLVGAALPTAWFMTTNIVHALGYMVPPGLIHLYADNAIHILGQRTGCLRYLPELSVEHLHPAAGKAPWDARYAEVNSQAQYHADQAAYDAYVSLALDEDVAKIMALM